MVEHEVYQPYVWVGAGTHGSALVHSYNASRAAYNHAHAEGVTW